jgi:hypothetical protein
VERFTTPLVKLITQLSFIGRDLNTKTEINQNHYKREDFELYGPIWIYVTLLVEFVILGHLTNQMADS